MRPVKPTPGKTAPGVIETLSSGFEQVNRVLWVIALPILVDLFLWLGPRVSAASVFTDLGAWYSRMTATYASVADAGADPSTVGQAQQAVTTLATQAGHFNLLTFLVITLSSVPSILPPARAGSPTLQLGTVGTLIGGVLLMQALGMLLGCLYLGAIGQQVRDGKVALLRLGRRVWFYWLSVIGFILLLIGVGLVISVPLALVIGLIQLIAPAFGAALMYAALAAMQIAAVLLMVYLFFLVDAIIVSEVGPVSAVIRSARVVANNFWSAVGFIFLVYIISLGMAVIWKALSGSPAGVVVAIIGNAYIASGLAAASLLFYQSRVARLPAVAGVLGRVSA